MATTALLLQAGQVPSSKDVTHALREPFIAIDANYDDLFARCTTDEERAALKFVRDAARDAFWKATAVAVEPGNVMVAHVYEELADANRQIGAQLQELQDIVKVINFLTELAKLATSLATLAGV